MAQLRKRLGNAGIDLNNPRVNESFVLIGTPLPPLEKTKDANEFVPLWKQEVRDEKGRRRLHGAFTGGFSAGYFNTVGSKEGWTPSTFKSSRSDRAKGKSMRPEDFMDEEDLAEMQESRKLVDKDELAGPVPQPSAEDDSISAALANLLPPSNESVGAQILKKMGWKPGQGIGPRLTYEQLRKRSELDGMPLPAVDSEEAKKHTYAPRDTRLPDIKRKDDFYGLGYIPAAGLRDSRKKESNGPKISAGFGLGALNDADDDDIDVYDGGLPTGGRRLAFQEGDEEDDRDFSSRRKSGKKVSTFQSDGFFQNGATLLSGFVIADIAVPPPRKFDPPDVPEDWEPEPNRVWGSKWDVQPVHPSQLKLEQQQGTIKSHEDWKKGMSADERGEILGETPLPTAKKSIWDYISQKDRERLQLLKTQTPFSSTEKPILQAPVQVDIPHIDPPVAKAALLGFQPFKENALKQARYTAYITSQANGTPMILQPLPEQSIPDFNAELESFAKAAVVFKPMSAAMASRFQSSRVVEKEKRLQEGLWKPSEEDFERAGVGDQKAETKMEVEESPKDHAARMGMFGALTRDVKSWEPNRLLCKRFHVAVPKVLSEDLEAKEEKEEATTRFDDPMNIDPNAGAVTRVIVNEGGTNAAADGEAGRSGGKKDIANIGLGEDDTQGADILTYQRPDMDIFKAIFASDEEDSDDEEKKEGRSKEVPAKSEERAPEASTKASEPVNLATFRPTFVARSKPSTTESVTKKRDKKRPKPVGALSFMEDEEGHTVVPSVKKRKRDKEDGKEEKKKRKEKDVTKVEAVVTKMDIDEDDDEMWVEKEAPAVVKEGFKTTPATPSAKSRPKAADFL